MIPKTRGNSAGHTTANFPVVRVKCLVYLSTMRRRDEDDIEDQSVRARRCRDRRREAGLRPVYADVPLPVVQQFRREALTLGLSQRALLDQILHDRYFGPSPVNTAAREGPALPARARAPEVGSPNRPPMLRDTTASSLREEPRPRGSALGGQGPPLTFR